MMKNTWRGIMHNTWRISRKLPRNMADDDADHFYDAEGEPSANNNANNLSDNTDRPPPIPPSDTDSTVEDGSQWDNSYAPAPFYRLTSSAQTSPLSKSPWSLYTEQPEAADSKDNSGDYVGLMTSLVREEGHIYSLAASGDLLYTGSSSRNIRVWKSHKEYTGFKCHSGLVKSIVISGEKVFTGHQDGKIRVWKTSRRDPKVHKKIGTLPSFTSVVKNMMIPKSYTEMAGNHSGIWIKHLDAISSLSLNEDQTLLYSGSWDKTLKVWRVSDFECLESICAHEDVINVVVAGFDGFVFSGAADGTLKVWRKEYSQGKRPKHYFSHTLLKQEFAVTSLAVNPTGMVVYAGCSDGVVQFWEQEKLTHGGALRGHKLAVLCLAATGNMVFSGSADKHICVWQRDEGGAHKCLYVLNGHTGPVKCLAVEEDGGNGRCILYSGSLDKSVKIWRMGRQVSLKCNQQLPPPSPQRIDGLRRSRK